MKRIDLEALINEILTNNPDFFDGFTTKELKAKFESEHNVKPSIQMLNSILVKLTDSETETGDGCILARGDEHGNGDSKMRGIHHYCWFLT